MWAKIRDLATAMLVANYVLAVTAGALFHDHGHRHQGEEGAGHLLAPGWARSAEGHGDGRCSICEFLAQKPIPAHPIEEVACTAATEERPRVAPLLLTFDLPSTRHIRAPPRVV